MAEARQGGARRGNGSFWLRPKSQDTMEIAAAIHRWLGDTASPRAGSYYHKSAC
jgi:hypothetical protein